MEKIRATGTERLLAIAMVFSVMTQLRVAEIIGVSEVIILYIGIFGKYPYEDNIIRYHKYQDNFLKGIFLVMPLGLAWNFITKDVFPQTVHDLFALIFAAFLCFMVLNRAKIYENLLGILYSFFFFETIANVMYIAMYFTGRGFYDENFERFEGWSTDPNQLAEALLLIPWLAIYFIRKVVQEKPQNRFFCIIISIACTVSSIGIGVITKSDSYVLASVIAIGVYLVVETVKIFVTQRGNRLVLLADIAGIAYLLLNTSAVMEFVNEYITKTAEDSNQLNVRERVWINGLKAFVHSPIFGNGPGSFSGQWGAFGGAESHNTYIYVMMDFGIVGLVLLLMLLYNAFKETLTAKASEMTAAFVSFLVFNFFHSFHRMPLFWFYLYLFIAVGIAETRKYERV